MATTEPLVGREAELNGLLEFLRDEGEPVVALLTGQAGVGKTTLLSAAASEAASAGASVMWARPTQAEASSSYGALHDLMGPTLNSLSRLAEPQRRAVAAALGFEDAAIPVEPRLVGTGCLSLLDELPRPALLAVDDW